MALNFRLVTEQLEDFAEVLMSLDSPIKLNMARLDTRKSPWFIPPKILDEHLLLMGIKGKVRIRIGNEWIILTPGMSLWIPPGNERELGSVAESGDQAHFKVRFNLTSSNETNIVGLDTPYLLRYDSWPLKLYFRDLIHNLKPTQLASACGLSSDYFSRVFKVKFGVSPRQFLKEEKLRRISEFLMESEKSIKEIYLCFGYKSEGLFYRQFKDYFKTSPEQYRKV